MSDNLKLAEIANLTLAELVERLGDLTPAELTELGRIEAAGANRKGALAAIAAALETTGAAPGAASVIATAANDGPVPARDPASAPSAAVTDEPETAQALPWQAEDWDGPLSIPQAAWRRAHLKGA